MRTFHYPQIDSTHAQAKRLIASHRGEKMLVVAQTQTAGRGRGDRPWQSPLGGAWWSLAWPTNAPADRYTAVPLIAGWAVLQALKPRLGNSAHQLQIKWPNDVLLEEKKIAGVLSECIAPPPSDPGLNPTLIVGVGVNANFHAAKLGDPLRYPATTLMDVLGRETDLQPLITHATANLCQGIEQLEQHGLQPSLVQAIEAHLAWKGTKVSLRIGGREVSGVCDGLDPAGRLRLQIAGQAQAFIAGEVERLTVRR